MLSGLSCAGARLWIHFFRTDFTSTRPYPIVDMASSMTAPAVAPTVVTTSAVGRSRHVTSATRPDVWCSLGSFYDLGCSA